ncbi:MAG: BON domain-containing protein [Hyphomicrobiales bacterium]
MERCSMRNNTWQKSILLVIPLLLVLPLVNTAGAGSNVMSDNDRAITSAVEQKLQSDSQLMGSMISVETIGGEVTLKGTVSSNADINRAAELARSIDGVKMVDNRLKRGEASSSYGGMTRAPDCPVGANWSC